MADRALASVIKTIESANDPRALRFEPGVFAWPLDVYGRQAIVSHIALVHHCTQATAHVIFSTSYGLYQIMGFNLWGRLNLGMDEFDYRASETFQNAAFENMLSGQGIDYTLADLLADPAKMTHFATVWNGPGNVDGYSALIRKYAT